MLSVDDLVAATVVAIGNVVYDNDLGHLLAAPTDVEVAMHDIAVVGAPDLVIEIPSSNRDYDERLKYRSY